MEDGWIKMYRVFLEWEWYSETNMVRLFLHLLLKANFEDKRWRGIVIKRGQLVTSISNLHTETRLSERAVRTCLDRLVKTGEIDKQTTSQYTIITICKYEEYQQVEEGKRQTNDNQATSERQSNDKRTTSERQQHKNIRSKELKNILPTNVGSSSENSADPNPKEEKIDFVGLLDFWNKTMESSGAVIPKIKSLSERRKSNIKARVREHSKRAVFEVITKAGASDFLNGRNKNGWVADFDWIFRPNNFPKVLEGNYDNRTNNYQPQINGTSQFTDQRQAERDNLARGLAATIARRFAEDDARQAEVRQP